MTRNNQETTRKPHASVGKQPQLHRSPPLLFLIQLWGDESEMILRWLLGISQNGNKRIFVVASGCDGQTAPSAPGRTCIVMEMAPVGREERRMDGVLAIDDV